jgi:transposase
MSFELVAIDVGKSSFHLHAVSGDGGVLSRKVTRAKLFAAVREPAPICVAMEACPGAHH